MTPSAGSDGLDLVLFGASGFTGRLVAAHLAEHAGEGVRIGLAGRSPSRLEAVRAGLGEPAASWPLLVADSGDPASLEALADATRVVVSTVGPYAPAGSALVGACAGHGTHYADLTGEVLFHRRVIDAHQARAEATGARIVPSCGFDSVPSDLAVMLAARAAAQDGAGDLTETVLVVRSVRAGVSGGTLATARVQAEEMTSDPRARRTVADSYALSPDRTMEPKGKASPRVSRDPATGGHVAPFVMASYNTRVVRRSNALTRWAYGRDLRYTEVLATGTGPRGALTAAVSTAGLGLFAAAHATRPTRALLHRVLPDAGEGPDAERMRSGRYRLELLARTSSGRGYRVRFEDGRDPGYTSTAVMIGEAGLLLAGADGAAGLPWDVPAAGLLTPATAFGMSLVDRLVAQGFTIDVAPW